MVKKAKKLTKISVETAKLYEKAGFGSVVNELPFQCRVHADLRENGINIWVESYNSSHHEAHVINIEPEKFLKQEFDNHYDALENSLQIGLKILIDKDNGKR